MSRRALVFVLLLGLTSCNLRVPFHFTLTATPEGGLGTLEVVGNTPDCIGPGCQPTREANVSLCRPEGESGLCLVVTPTRGPLQTAAPQDGRVKSVPYVEISSSASEVELGEQVTVCGQVVDIGLPIFYVQLVDMPGGETMSFRVQKDRVEQKEGQSGVLELVEFAADNCQVSLTFRGSSAGRTQINISATGEIHSSGGAMWSGGGSESIEIVVHGP